MVARKNIKYFVLLAFYISFFEKLTVRYVRI